MTPEHADAAAFGACGACGAAIVGDPIVGAALGFVVAAALRLAVAELGAHLARRFKK